MRRWLICLLLFPVAHVAEGQAPDKPVARLDGAGGSFVAFSPDGSRLLTAGGHTARVWDARTFAPIAPVLHHPDQIPGDDGLYSLDQAFWSADGRSVVLAGTAEVRIWDAGSDTMLIRVAQSHRVVPTCLSPDGALLITGNGLSGANVWDVGHVSSGARLIRTLGQGELSSAVFSSDGKRLLTLFAGRTCQLWDSATWKEVLPPIEWLHDTFCGQPCFSPDGRKFALPAYGRFVLYDAQTGTETLRAGITTDREYAGTTTLVRFASDGQSVVLATWGSVTVFDAKSGILRGRPISAGVYSPSGIDISHGGTSIAIATPGSAGGIFDLATGARIQTLGNESAYCIAFSPDGQTVATGRADGITAIWHVRRR